MDKNVNEIKDCLHRISNTLMINGGYSGNPGLYSGDMGIVLFFNHYALFTQNKIYSEYASYLLDKTQNKLNQFTPFNYKQGLTGIGSAIEYLAQNGYIVANTDEILEVFDKRIFFTYHLSYLPVDKIVDIGCYVLWRMAGKSVLKDTILKSAVSQIVNVMEERQTSLDLTHPTVSFFRDIFSAENFLSLQDRAVISTWFQSCRENNAIGRPQGFAPTMPLTKFDLGIQNGLAGLGLSFISELDGVDSWASLFPPIFECQLITNNIPLQRGI